MIIYRKRLTIPFLKTGLETYAEQNLNINKDRR